MRINRYLAQCGCGSRRGVEKLIEASMVMVNGLLCTDKATQIDPAKDKVKVNGRKIALDASKAETWLFNKPCGYLCTREDPEKRKSIFELLSHLPPPFQAVGRLDKNSRGLLIITKNGDLANILLHPRYEIKKKYHVRVHGDWDGSYTEKLKKGVQMEEGGIGRMDVLDAKTVAHQETLLSLELSEGKKREIRYSMKALDLSVIDLQRVSIDFLALNEIKEGDSRPLSDDETKKIKSLINRYSSDKSY